MSKRRGEYLYKADAKVPERTELRLRSAQFQQEGSAAAEQERSAAEDESLTSTSGLHRWEHYDPGVHGETSGIVHKSPPSSIVMNSEEDEDKSATDSEDSSSDTTRDEQEFPSGTEEHV
ncbi:hypothetical protein V5799_021174 [Amblyomma americanum]|uniref:Uncharacterized protein n=1 Tax=Amblyomma americanum TaxID=6943 RepID=A0AAQ4FPA9_AMBAM